MVGGPAFASGIIHPGDLITRIDGRDIEHDTMLAALKGVNEAGSEVEIMFRSHTTDEEELVVLRRVNTEEIADHREMFDFFITMLNQTKRKKDDEMRGVVQEAMELWSEMVREELENDAECARRLRGLK